MVFPIGAIAAGAGALAAGIGVFRGASRAGKAAETVASSTDRFLASIAGDVKEVKTVLVTEVWPAMNVTLMRFNGVLLDAQRFIETGTFATKALTLLILLCSVLVCKYITTTPRMPTRNRKRRSVTFQEVAVQFVSWLCLLMAGVLVCHLITEIRQITSPPGSIPFIFIIPSFSMLMVCLQYTKHILKAFLKLVILICYCTIGFPIDQFKSPAEKASRYSFSIILSSLLFPAIILSYGLISFFATLILKGLFKRQRPLSEKIFLAYIYFYIAALAIYFIMEIVMIIIRGLWAFLARRRYFQGYLNN